MTDGDLQYDGQLTDKPPLTLAIYGYEWRNFLLGVAQILAEPTMWAESADLQIVSEQVNDLLVRLMGEDVTGLIYPYTRLMLLGAQFTWVVSGGATVVINNAQMLNVFWRQTTPALNQVILGVYMYLSVGDYVFTIIGVTGPDGGKVRWGLDGVYPSPGGDNDQYSAVITYNVEQAWSIGVSEAGVHYVTLKNFGKSAASTNYYFRVSAVTVRGPEPQ